MDPIVSIIMPVYNSEQYISASILSVLNQSYQNFELLIIDDCSTDNSMEIIKKYAKQDNRIRIFNTDINSGPSKTRNIGLDNANGVFVSFIDSDDEYKPNFLTKLLDVAFKFNTDIAWCNYEVHNSNGTIKIIKNNVKKEIILDQEDAIGLIFRNESGMGSLCNKLYRKKLIEENKIRLNELRVRAEDWEFNIDAFQHLNKLICIDESLYIYRKQNLNSVMATYREQDLYRMMDTVKMLQSLQSKYSINVKADFFNSIYYGFLEQCFKASRNKGLKAKKEILFLKNSKEFKYIEYNSCITNLPIRFQLMSILIKFNINLSILFARLK